MPVAILATKLYIPKARAKLVPRNRLLEQLNNGFHRKLSLISAPAGFGKTTVVSEWLASCEQPTAWLSLEEGDSEPTRFLTYLVAALQTVTPNFGEGVLAQLHSPQPPASEIMLTALLNDISTLSENFILVLDDYHLIDSKEVDNMLSFLLEHLPPQMHLVITTREDPQLPLPRLRVRNELTELRASDLRFTLEEAADFFNQMMGLSLSADNIAKLEARTEGWIAGLQMTALSMQGRADTSSFIQAFTGDHHFILDYLIEEVLEQQPDSIQLFLLQTSILERLSGSLCDAVTEREDGVEILEKLERANLFVIPLDDTREWYRYHHLFADVLKARLLKGQAQDSRDLHKRASLWFEQNSFTAEAVHHALKAEEFEQAAALIELAWRNMDVNFQSATWLSWAKQLPDDIVYLRPVLSVGYAWALLNQGEFETMEAYLKDAETHLDATPINTESAASLRNYIVSDEDEFRALPVTIASARAYKAQALGDSAGTIKHAARALELLPENNHSGRGIPLSLLGLAYWVKGDVENAYASLSKGMLAFQKAGNTMAAISGVFAMADMQVWQGQLYKAIDTYKQALAFVATKDDAMNHRVAILHLGLSELYQEQGKGKLASEHWKESERLKEQNTEIIANYRRLLAQARLYEAQAKFESALEALNEAETLFEQIHIPNVQPVAAIRAQLWLRQGKLDAALAWAKAREFKAQDEISYLSEFEYITFARILIAHYRRDKKPDSIQTAMTLLSKLYKAVKSAKGMGVAINILILKALAQQAQNNITAALESLQEALILAEPEDYVQTFSNEGAPMLQLLTQAKAQGIQVPYVTRLLKAFEMQKKPEGTFLSDASNQALTEPLTKRELEVLKLLAEGLSNHDISKRLYRALDTVKGYNRTIFGKLQVQNRTEAVAKAHELNLL